ncbi:hypothetical protein [Cellulomonas carbonis]|uniref:hypothetical protein n=1 Tax=Cellulomonas carbonis TaxID=1386092 RepID=UPI0005BDDF7E|nr:hypothetical protein [Cellulomonas carbonis]GGB92185.1 hypothetical protein GCM10010972_01070 [Cellulomonas carbonis]
MPLFRRRPALPDDVRERLGAARSDVLAVAELADGWAVATRAGLAVVRGEDVLRRAWTDVDAARLSDETSALTVTWVDGTPATELALVDRSPGGLPRVLHERVQSSVVHHEQVALPGRRTVRVVLRRDADGRLFTQVIGTGHVDLTDPSTARAVDEAEARVREAAGLS